MKNETIKLIMDEMKECVIIGNNHGFLECWWDLKEYLEVIPNIDIKRFSALSPKESKKLVDREWLCPTCKSKVGDCCEVDNYCRYCGQKLNFN